MSIQINNETRQFILSLARASIKHYLAHQEQLPLPDAIPDAAILQAECGVFVSLKKSGQLRGCIGTISGQGPLIHSLIQYAIYSAFNDHRFPALIDSELPEVQIEISILTPAQSVASYHEIQIGQHGMILKKNGRSAVFLPQVAPENQWDLATTLTHLAQKAGLQALDWQEGAEFWTFEAIVLAEASASKTP